MEVPGGVFGLVVGLSVIGAAIGILAAILVREKEKSKNDD